MKHSSVAPFSCEGIDLLEPQAFYSWLDGLRASEHPPLEIARMLANIGTHPATLRAAQLYVNLGEYDRVLQLAGLLHQSDDPVFRACGVRFLALHEEYFDHQEGDVTGSRSTVSTQALEQALEHVIRTVPRTLFTAETELRLRYDLSNLYADHRQCDKALAHASEAILIAKWLGVPSLLHAARLAYAAAASRLEHLSDARTQFEIVASSEDARPPQRLFANVNYALLLIRNGEDDDAGAWLRRVLEQNPGEAVAASTLQYAEALCGLTGEDDPVLPCPSGNYDLQVRAMQLLEANHGKPRESDLQAVMALLSDWRPNSETVIPMVQWLQGLALSRLNQPRLASLRVRNTQSNMPDVCIMLHGLRLEIALRFGSDDVGQIAQLCSSIRSLITQATNLPSKLGLAKRLSFWHPLAAAFVAVSPESIPQLVDASLPAVFKDGRPITVYGSCVQSRLPFVQATLEAFGVSSQIPRDQHTEQERMKNTLLVVHGRRQRWLPIVPPALLVFKLIQVAETYGESWRHAALDVAVAHGLVPKTFGGHLRAEREALQRALQSLIRREIDSSALKQIVLALPGSNGHIHG